MATALARLLRGPFLQTLGAAAPLHCPPRSFEVPETELLRVRARHGAFVGAVHAEAWFGEGRAPTVIVVHGIGGDAGSRYVVRAAVALRRAGYHVIRMTMRGAAASVECAPSLYHAGLTEDLDALVRVALADPRVSSAFVLGFSGGGNVALKLAGELGDEAPEGLRGIVTVSAPFDYTTIGPHMDAPARLPFRFHVLRGLVRQARAFARLYPERAAYDVRRLSLLGSFRDYDANVVVPTYGFDDVDQYWAVSGARAVLSRVAVPSLVVHAYDDPMVPGATVRDSLAEASSSIELEMSADGGHIGWYGGLDEESFVQPWAVRRALAFFARHTP